jgi:hypothetical protein
MDRSLYENDFLPGCPPSDISHDRLPGILGGGFFSGAVDQFARANLRRSGSF